MDDPESFDESNTESKDEDDSGYKWKGSLEVYQFVQGSGRALDARIGAILSCLTEEENAKRMKEGLNMLGFISEVVRKSDLKRFSLQTLTKEMTSCRLHSQLRTILSLPKGRFFLPVVDAFLHTAKIDYPFEACQQQQVLCVVTELIPPTLHDSVEGNRPNPVDLSASEIDLLSAAFSPVSFPPAPKNISPSKPSEPTTSLNSLLGTSHSSASSSIALSTSVSPSRSSSSSPSPSSSSSSSLSQPVSSSSMSPSDLLTVYFQWFQEICGGLHIIHSQGLVHNRIVPASLLMPEDLFSQANKKQEKPITALIHDFGLLDRPGEAINGACVGFTAPEILKYQKSQFASDVYSAAKVVLFSLFDGDSKTAQIDDWTLLHKLEEIPNAPLGIVETFKLCLSHSPEVRPSAYALFQADPLHPWRPYAKIKEQGKLTVGQGTEGIKNSVEVWKTLRVEKDEIELDNLMAKIGEEMQGELKEGEGTELGEDLAAFRFVVRGWLIAEQIHSKSPSSKSSFKVKLSQFKIIWSWVGPAPILPIFQAMKRWVNREELIPAPGCSFFLPKSEGNLPFEKLTRRRSKSDLRKSERNAFSGKEKWIISLSAEKFYQGFVCRSSAKSNQKTLYFSLTDEGYIQVSPELGNLTLKQVIEMTWGNDSNPSTNAGSSSSSVVYCDETTDFTKPRKMTKTESRFLPVTLPRSARPISPQKDYNARGRSMSFAAYPGVNERQLSPLRSKVQDQTPLVSEMAEGETKGWKVRAQQLQQQRKARLQTKMYAVPIEECVNRPNRSDAPRHIPWLVYDILTYIRKDYMKVVGLFRLAGEKLTTDEWKKKIDQGEDLDLQKVNNVHSAADLLKIWLRTLPEPIVTARLYPRFMSVGKVHDVDLQIKYLAALAAALPEPNLSTMKYLFHFLRDLSLGSEVNKMTPENIGTCIGPNILFEKGSDPSALFTGFEVVIQVLSRMIENYGAIFEEKAVMPLKTYKALSAHVPKEKDKKEKGEELVIAKGDIVHVFYRDDKKIRAYGECNDKFGWFPHVIVKKRVGIKKRKGLDTETLPQGFNPNKAELYLSDGEFMVKFGITKNEFLLLPQWKQEKLKDKAGFS